MNKKTEKNKCKTKAQNCWIYLYTKYINSVQKHRHYDMNMEYRSMCAKLHFIWKWWDRRDDSYGAYAFDCICCAVRLRQCHCEAIIKWSHCRKWIATWFPWDTAAFVNFFLLFFHFVLCHCVCVCGIITSSATFYFCLYLFWHFGLCLRFALFFFFGHFERWSYMCKMTW